MRWPCKLEDQQAGRRACAASGCTKWEDCGRHSKGRDGDVRSLSFSHFARLLRILRFVRLTTISDFYEVSSGNCDNVPEAAFYMVEGLADVKEKAASFAAATA